MTWNRKRPDLVSGATYGCFVVVRLAQPDIHGRRIYVVRTTCCGREVKRQQWHLENAAPKSCVKCATRRRAVAKSEVA